MSNKQDIEMTNNKDNKDKNNLNEDKYKPNAIYAEYKKLLITMDKAASLKDLKSLFTLYSQINKFRINLKKQDFVYISNEILNNNYPISILNNFELNEDIKEQLNRSFNFNSKTIAKLKEIPEIKVFNKLLMILYLIDNKKCDEAFELLYKLINEIKDYDLYTLSHLKASTYYYLCLEAEKLNKLYFIMPDIHNAYRIACLNLDEETQVTLINCILRYYIINNSYEQARNFLSKSRYIENISLYQDARYLYYLGRINSIQLNYSTAFANLTNCLRKAPDNNVGFRTHVEKLILIVELLMGEIPDLTKYHKLKKLGPYLALLKSVKKGDLKEFKTIVNNYKGVFFNDKNYSLILRLRLIVIKVGLRKINLSYSKISIKDICDKLSLESEKEAQLIIMKAIRDGVFLAKINSETGIVESQEITDIYSTFDPQKAFLRRIEFLNHINNEALKGIKYPDNKDKKRKSNEIAEDEDLGFEGQYLDL